MKLFLFFICMLTVTPFAFAQDKSTLTISTGTIGLESNYEKQLKVIEEIKKNIITSPVEIESNIVLRIMGFTALAGFIASVAIFKEELFGTVPLTLLAAGVTLIILSI